MLILRSGLAALAITLAAPVAAHAATATFAGSTLTVTGDASGEQFAVSDAGANVRVTASSAGLADPDGAGTDCVLANANTVDCLDSSVDAVTVNAGDGADTVTFSRGAFSGDDFTGNGEGDNDSFINTFGTNDQSVVNGGPGDDNVGGLFGTISGGDGNDTITNTSLNDQDSAVDGGPGNDTINGTFSSISGGDGDDTITNTSSNAGGVNGGAGNDRIDGIYGNVNGGDGDDTLNAGKGNFSGDTGGPGNDTLNGSDKSQDNFQAEPGADTYTGGTAPRPPQLPAGDEYYQDSDSISYSGTAAVNVTLDNVANDGAAGEGDNVRSDIESISGGDGNDTLDATGATEPRQLYGGSGDDTLNGGNRSDTLSGANGSDTLNGGPGDDYFGGYYYGGDESIDPDNPATDQAGNDTYNGGDGDDSFGADSTISTVDPSQTTQYGSGLGSDTYNGGAGEDSISVSRTAISPRTPDDADPSSTLNTYVPVTVSLDGVANDGYPGATFKISGDIEDVYTGNGADTIVGNAAANVLGGGSGNDTIDGAGGVDLLYGDNGVDAITSRDVGFDKVDCGLGVDTPVQGDTIDQLSNCEGNAVLTAMPAPADTTKPKTKLSGGTKLKAKTFKKTRTIPVTVTPSEPVILEGQLFSGARSGTIGQTLLGKGKLGLKGGKRTLKIKVSKKVANGLVKQAKLRKKGVAVTVTVRSTDAAGLSNTASRTFTIKR